MRLREWMDINNHTAATLGQEMGVPFRTVEKWSRGERFPRPPMLAKIVNVTLGDVKANDLLQEQIRRGKM